ncbi:MAG: hypothetical protein J5842_04080, partial [Lachnospiraceae bacterium]|nr:hypothetical protein [Lachnospiraceae bacterium]
FKSGDHEVGGYCIGRNYEKEKYYLFSKDGKEVLTFSNPFRKKVPNQFYTQMDETVSESEMAGAQLSYELASFSNVVTVPAKCIKSETNQFSGEVKQFVWKIENGEPVKEFVTVYEPAVAMEKMMILKGVSEGDIILE